MRGGELFGPGTHVVEAFAAIVDSELYPEELEFLRGAAPSRRAEFGTARVCARAALARMGVAPAPLVPVKGRAPEWPRGVVGSISHTHGYCAVVVGPAPPLRSVGLDLELVRPLEAGVIDLILTARERAWLGEQPAARRAELAVAVFCAKEAFYKCQYPLTGALLEFTDAEVDLRVDEGRFEVNVLEPRWPLGAARLGGRVICEDGRVACGVELREGEPFV